LTSHYIWPAGWYKRLTVIHKNTTTATVFNRKYCSRPFDGHLSKVVCTNAQARFVSDSHIFLLSAVTWKLPCYFCVLSFLILQVSVCR